VKNIDTKIAKCILASIMTAGFISGSFSFFLYRIEAILLFDFILIWIAVILSIYISACMYDAVVKIEQERKRQSRSYQLNRFNEVTRRE